MFNVSHLKEQLVSHNNIVNIQEPKTFKRTIGLIYVISLMNQKDFSLQNNIENSKLNGG